MKGNKTMKKSKLLLVFSMVLMLAVVFAVAAAAEVASGKVNVSDEENDLVWEFNSETKTLTITGTSTDLTMNPAPAWNAQDNIPWKYLADNIEHVVVEAPVTSLCGYAFAYLVNCTDITLPDTVIQLTGYNTFAKGIKLNKLGRAGTPDGVIDLRYFIGEASQVFENCFHNLAITVLLPAQGTPAADIKRFGIDSAVVTIKAVEGSAGETWANDLIASNDNDDDYIPESITVVYYDGNDGSAAAPVEPTPEDTTTAAEDTSAAPEDTTTAAEEDTTAADPETTAAIEDTTVADEDTTAADEDTTAPGEAAQTGDINLVMVVAIAFAAMASAVVLTRKRFN